MIVSKLVEILSLSINMWNSTSSEVIRYCSPGISEILTRHKLFFMA